ncbi:MAG: mechanosensitive ion channel [Bacteroidetes bacterium]|nr:mechanosensitive ion channel [Bacteroidota bacterium]
MIQTENISFGLLVFLAIGAAIIIVGFWLLHRYVMPLIKSRQSNRIASIWLLRMEVLTWSLYALFAIYRLLLASPAITIIFIILLIVLGWNFWKSYFPGLLFRLEKTLEVGDSIRFNKDEEKMQEGIVQKISGRNVEIFLTTGEILMVPFHRLDSLIISKSHPEGNLDRHIFIVNFERNDISDKKTLITKILFECPWSVPAKDPIIENLGKGQYQITSFAVDKEASEKLMAYVLQRVEG